jgi:hypothetical protein
VTVVRRIISHINAHRARTSFESIRLIKKSAMRKKEGRPSSSDRRFRRSPPPDARRRIRDDPGRSREYTGPSTEGASAHGERGTTTRQRSGRDVSPSRLPPPSSSSANLAKPSSSRSGRETPPSTARVATPLSSQSANASSTRVKASPAEFPPRKQTVEVDKRVSRPPESASSSTFMSMIEPPRWQEREASPSVIPPLAEGPSQMVVIPPVPPQKRTADPSNESDNREDADRPAAKRLRQQSKPSSPSRGTAPPPSPGGTAGMLSSASGPPIPSRPNSLPYPIACHTWASQALSAYRYALPGTEYTREELFQGAQRVLNAHLMAEQAGNRNPTDLSTRQQQGGRK